MLVNKDGRVLWLLLAVTFPLFSMQLFRLKVGEFDIAIPMFVTGFVLMYYSCNQLIKNGGRKVEYNFRNYHMLAIFTYLFVVIHLFSSLGAESISLAISEVIKLSLGVICMFGFLMWFPSSKTFFNKFIAVMIWSSTLLTCFLIYKYIFVFNASYIGIDLVVGNKLGKNQLAWYISIVSIYAFFYFFSSKKRVFSFLPFICLWIVLIYVGSRGAWIAVTAGMLYTLFIAFRISFMRGIKMAFVLFIVMPLIVFGLVSFASLFLDNSNIINRITYIFKPQEVINLQSYEVRFAVVKEAVLEFCKAPIFGVGLTNYSLYLTRMTHNDFVAVLLELGSVGAFLYLGILLFVGKKVRLFSFDPLNENNWLIMANRAVFVSFIVSLFVLNVYTSLCFWLLLAFMLKTSDLEHSENEPKMVVDGNMAPNYLGNSTIRKELI